MAERQHGEAIWQTDGQQLSCNLRADSVWIRKLGLGPEVQCSSMLNEISVQNSRIILYLTFFRISKAKAPETSCFFFSYLNDAQHDKGLAYAQQLAQQNQLVLNLYGDEGTRERALPIPNVIRNFAKGAPRYLEPCQPWTQDAFTQACADLESLYTTPRALWEYASAAADKNEETR
jgi:hypothetical protein